MDNRQMIVWLTCALAAALAVGTMSSCVIQQTHIQQEERTKRADGRHQLFDFFHQLRP